MPRKPIWNDQDYVELGITEAGDLILIETEGGPFAATPDDARDIAKTLIEWADKQ